MELELFAPTFSLIPAPVDLPTIPCLCKAACGELHWCRHFPGSGAALSAALAEQQEGAGLLKGGGAIPLQEALVFCTGNLHPAGKEGNNQNQGLCVFPKCATSFGKTLLCLHLQGLGESDLSHSCNYQQP